VHPASVASIATPESTKPALVLVPAATHAVEEVEAEGDVKSVAHALHVVEEVYAAPPIEYVLTGQGC